MISELILAFVFMALLLSVYTARKVRMMSMVIKLADDRNDLKEVKKGVLGSEKDSEDTERLLKQDRESSEKSKGKEFPVEKNSHAHYSPSENPNPKDENVMDFFDKLPKPGDEK